MCETADRPAAGARPGPGARDSKRQRGAVMAEYVLVLSLILGVAAVAVGALGIGVNSLFLLFPN